jgi:mRNA-degrading endonuclease RelE of RelBE toxin-antitoxin system
MKIQQTLSFKSKAKKLHQNQVKELEAAIKKICNDPKIGVRKKGDLSEVNVYKFNMSNSLYLIAYTWDDKESLLTLLQLGVHENFYRDLKQ